MPPDPLGATAVGGRLSETLLRQMLDPPEQTITLLIRKETNKKERTPL